MRDHPDQLTLELRAGDAVVIDYRLLHATHANTSEERRDCLVLTLVTSWRDLPNEIRAHLIRHPALPSDSERAMDYVSLKRLLPTFDGHPHDLQLIRVAPREFVALD